MSTKILGIETSCDETAVAIVEDGTRIVTDVVASQVAIHARYGGIVPEVASRQHILTILPVLQEAAHHMDGISAVAVTMGPGLPGSLLVGVNTAKAIALTQNLPLIGINHIEAHIYANWLETNDPPAFPLLCLIVSGGHSDLVLMSNHGDYTVLGQTRDDAAGEAFDKVARILQLGYPGGPAIETAALQGNATAYDLPRAQLRGSLDFSFSGLKTATLHLFEETPKAKDNDPQTLADIAASFQQAVVDALTTKTILAAEKYQVRLILLAGGVASNQALRKAIGQHARVPVRYPIPKHCTDNAAMVAACGYFHFQSNKVDGLDLDVISGLRLGDS